MLLSLFLATLVSLTAHIDRSWAEVPAVASLPDIDSSGSPELSVLMRDTVASKNYAYVMDASDGVLIKKDSFLNTLTPLFQVVVPDVNGSGAPEIAMLGVTYASGVVDTVRVIVKDSVSGAMIKNIGFDKNFPPLAMAVVEYPSGHTASNVGIAVLGRKASTGPNTATVKVSVRDAVSGALITNTYFMKKFQPVAMAIVPDYTGAVGGLTNAPEIAVLSEGDADADAAGEVAVIIADSGVGAASNGWITYIGFAPSVRPVDLAVVPDMNANGSSEIAVLGVHRTNDKVSVVVKEPVLKSIINTIVFPTEYPPLSMAVVPSFAGTSAPEIAVLGIGDSALGGIQDKIKITIKDVSSGVKIGGALSFNKKYPAVGMAVLDNFAGTAASEIAVLGVDAAGGEKITVRDVSSAALISSFLLPPYVAGPSGDITRLSVASDGTQGNGNSYNPSINVDGRYVAFRSTAKNLVSGDTNGKMDIFVRDTLNNTTTRVSLNSLAAPGNDASDYPSISSDGRYVVFRSTATNLVAVDSNAVLDVFVRDTVSNLTTRMSVDSSGAQSNGDSGDKNRGAYISSDGRYVAFISYASNLVAGDANGMSDVFVRDTVSNLTTRISMAFDGTESNGNSEGGLSISADGRYVAFRSYASNLVAGDTNGAYDIFVRDTVNDITTRVSVSSSGTESNGNSGGSFISPDGRYVAFKSLASNLVSGDTNGVDDVFVHDRQTGVTTRASVASNGTQGDDGVGSSSISDNGRYVAFKSLASTLVAGDNNGVDDVFVHDMQTGVTTRVSVAADGTQGNGRSYGVSISSDGQYVTFVSYASNLVAGDTNGTWDIFQTTNPLYAPAYTVGGGVSGLSGTIVLQNNGGNDLSVSANGSFTFTTPIADGSAYAVTVSSQPSGQTCAVTSGSGTISGSNVTNVSVNCTTNATYTVGGSVSGLTGTGLILRNNLTNDLSISSDGSFTFTAPLSDGSPHAVTVSSQPSGQTCSVTNGVGTVNGSNITNVSVTCAGIPSGTYTVGGNVSSLTGTGLVLQNLGGDNLSISSSGSFVFATSLNNSSPYSVAVLTQPSGQSCGVTNGLGMISGTNITNVAVECAVTNSPNVAGPASPTGNGTPTWTWTSGGGGNGAYQYQLDGESGAWAATTGTSYMPGSVLPDGAHTLYVQESNGSAWSSSGSFAITIDTGLPVTSATPVGGRYASQQSISLSCTDGSGCDAIYYTTDGSTPTTSSSQYSVPLTTGLYRTTVLKFFAVDLAGNSAAVTTATYATRETAPLHAGMFHSVAYKSSDNTAWAWGLNSLGQLGTGGNTNSNVPLQVSGVSGVSGIGAGHQYSSALESNGSLWFWGENADGQLGDNSTVQRNSPVQVVGQGGSGTLANVFAFADGNNHALAVQTDGTLWSWGDNDFGQLGNGGAPTDSSTPLLISGVTDVVAVAAGVDHSIALKADGSVWTWGQNADGQLGDGTTIQRNTPVQVSGLSGVVAIASGTIHSVALKADGSVWTWGDNSNGQLGNGTAPTDSTTPVQVNGLSGIVSIASEMEQVFAVKGDGTLWSWGNNANGRLGDGTTTNRSVPVQVVGQGGVGFLTNIVAAGAGHQHSLALDSSGQFWAWGNNNNGQLGDGTTTQRTTPVQVSVGAATYTVGGGVSGLSGTIVLQNNGGNDLSISANGSFTFTTPVGDGSPYSVTVSSQPSGQTCTVTSGSGTVSGSNVTNVSVNCTVDSAYTVGGSVSGLTGTGLTLDLNSGAQVLPVSSGFTSFVFTTPLSGGSSYAVTISAQPSGQTCSLTNGVGTVNGSNITNVSVICSLPYTIGGSVSGLTGTGLVLQNLGGDNLSISSNGSFTFATPIASGSAYAVTVLAHPSAQTCGVTNGSGTVSGANITNVTVDCTISSAPGSPNVMGPASPTGNSKPLWTWTSGGGGNGAYQYQLDGESGAWAATTGTSYMPGSVLPDGAHTLYVQESNGLVWSSSGSFAITIDTGLPVTSATPVGGRYASQQSISLGCTDGSGCDAIYYTTDGSTPTTSSSQYSVPLTTGLYRTTVLKFFAVDLAGNSAAVTTATYATRETAPLHAGMFHSVAYKSSDNTAWAWGLNSLGQLGTGGATNSNVPLQVSGVSGVSGIGAGHQYSSALESNGSLWFWGENADGQLGDNSTVQRNSPVQVVGQGGSGTLANVFAFADGNNHALAVQTDGTLWSWGDNDFGQLGNGGAPTDSSAPLLISGVTDVVAVAAGVDHSIALKADGSVWTWGQNADGQLGDGTTIQRNTPVQVSGLSGVVAIASGTIHSVALKADGSVWTWGDNSNGQLGNGTAPTDSTTPVQVIGLSGIVSIASEMEQVFAVKGDGTLWSWGNNANGRLGDGTTTNRSVPVQVVGQGGVGFLTNIVAAGAGHQHSLALDSSGQFWAWGNNNNGQLGDGTTTQRTTPVQVSAF